MKTLLQISLVLLGVVSIHSAQAQVQQGSFRVGGSAGYSRIKFDDENRYSQFSMRPAVAYFPVAKLSVGLTTSLTIGDGDYYNSTYNSTDFSVGPEVRYYFPFGKWAVFPEIIYSFGKTVSEGTFTDFYPDPGYQTESTYNSFRGGIGLTYFVNPYVGLEGILYYQNSVQTIPPPFPFRTDGSSLNFSIGLQIYLNRS